jgi:hypothetical protein
MKTTLSQYNWQKGTLHYMSVSGYYPEQMRGWFMLSTDGRTVLARKIKGRNVWQFADVNRVLDFSADILEGGK